MTKCLVSLPTYGGVRRNFMSIANMLVNYPFDDLVIGEHSSSLLAHTFNQGWVEALNERKNGLTHWVLLHADVVPMEADWLVRMKAIMDHTRAEVLSVILPIKGSAVTSTAVETDDVWNPRKLTRDEVAGMQETWDTAPDRLVNTGCMMVDLKAPWVESVHFTIQDRIVKAPDGSFRAECIPEDWDFTRKVRQHGGSVWATRAIRALHVGDSATPNF